MRLYYCSPTLGFTVPRTFPAQVFGRHLMIKEDN